MKNPARARLRWLGKLCMQLNQDSSEPHLRRLSEEQLHYKWASQCFTSVCC